MVAEGSAHIVMGNHEFNAISYATRNPDAPDEFLRLHNEKNRRQHEEFIEQIKRRPGLYESSIEWFKTFPLYLDLDGLRVVHACWHDEAIGTVTQQVAPGMPMLTGFVIRANQKGTPEHDAIEVLLKGPELSLTKYEQPAFRDKDGHVRHEARIRWWNADGTTLRDLAEIPGDVETEDLVPYPPLPEIEAYDGDADYDYVDTKPVFYGHYWRSWAPEQGRDWTANTVCVDFSAVKGGRLVAYRWDGDLEITSDNYVDCK
jgi:hypothetical protein